MDNIRNIRIRLRLTQVELAEKIGLTQASISRLETDKQPIDKRTALALEALLLKSEAGIVEGSHCVTTLARQAPACQSNRRANLDNAA
jgi:transcriptional regulator with XRE-family HTH domain